MALDKTIYIGAFVHCATLTELEICTGGSIGVGDDGKIAFVIKDRNSESLPAGWEAAREVKIKDHGFFFPGFIGIVSDTHIHAPQYPNAGVFGKSTLLDWLNTYTFPLESSFSDLANAGRIYKRVVSRTLSHGTTTACYYATVHVPATNLLADICKEKGQRAFVGRVCMDQMSPDYYRDESVDSAIEASRACIQHVKEIDPGNDIITSIITPRFALSCSTEAMKRLGDLHRETGVPCQTHISENPKEIELVREVFPECSSYADVYDKAGLLTPKMILAHAVHLSKDERALIKKRETKISHCPASNTALTSGAAKVRELMNDGITVGLGTDVSGGYTPSMLAEAREAIFTSRHRAMLDGDEAKLSTEEVLYLATRGGAKVVGLEERIGGFEVGKDWDAQMVSIVGVDSSLDLYQTVGPVEIFGGESWDDKVAKWLYTGDDRNTAAVWVKGRLVHKTSNFEG
ncbi:guanine deaminase [Polychaeton citri CBS 116435]|uniref:Guanine deaminase n=1 Tax=Polychaeton citri CBS 116435 TaxID=1314669 RepID=A0A9P4QCA6_9PEZI|nr:guanine deaminase [Polychaeton citri CBS 116435]